VNKFPKSVYAEANLRELGGLNSIIGQLEKALAVYRELLNKHPETNYYNIAITAVLDYFRAKKDKAGALREMKELMKKHPNSKIADRVRKAIQYIEKW
jgi:tetratricopeptide (TPR) repeat protein